MGELQRSPPATMGKVIHVVTGGDPTTFPEVVVYTSLANATNINGPVSFAGLCDDSGPVDCVRRR